MYSKHYSVLIEQNLTGFTDIYNTSEGDHLILIADAAHSTAGVMKRRYWMYFDGLVDVVTTYCDGKKQEERISIDDARKDRAFESVMRVFDFLGQTPRYIDIHHSLVPKWNFIYDEEYGDDPYGSNFSGVIARSDGNFRCLFFHAYCNKEGARPFCHIYDSILSMTQHENEICSYPWTRENDSILLHVLDSLENPQDYSGDNSPLRTIEFIPYEEDHGCDYHYALVLWPMSQRFIGRQRCYFYSGEGKRGAEFDSNLSQAVFVPEDIICSLSPDEVSNLSDCIMGRYFATSVFDERAEEGRVGNRYRDDDEYDNEDYDEDEDVVVFLPIDEV